MDDYKKRKEDFVSGYNGTTLTEVTYASLVVPSSFLVRNVVFTYIAKQNQGLGRWLASKPLGGFMLDFFFLIIPIVLSMTYTEHLQTVLLGQVSLSIGLAALSIFQKEKKGDTSRGNYEQEKEKQLALFNSERKTFVTEYRSGLMLSTCLAILAVDFAVFPRRFCKTETYGTSLMDTGVGLFVLSHALTSSMARRYSEPSTVPPGPVGGKRNSKPVNLHPSPVRVFLIRGLISASPMLLLGFIRMILVKGVNYQEHVSEYGVHWNFFFTLGVVAFFSTIVNAVLPSSIAPTLSAVLGLTIILVYQALLSWSDLAEYVLNAPRLNLFSANKEGIIGSLGYLSLYLIGVQIGAYIFKPKARLRHWWLDLFVLLLIDGALWWLTVYLNDHDSSAKISRRLVNLGYVLWILALNILLLCIFLASHLALGSLTLIGSPLANPRPSFLALAINQNSLFFFLLANILTGLINVSLKTIDAAPLTAFSVLFVYILLVYGIAGLLYHCKISIKDFLYQKIKDVSTILTPRA